MEEKRAGLQIVLFEGREKNGGRRGCRQAKGEKHVYEPAGRYGSVMPVEGILGTTLMPGVFAQAGIDAVVLGFFIAMYQVAKTKPLAACVGALVGFWALHLILALFNPASLFQGVPIKVLFTLALIRGIQQARSAQRMIDELAEVFS